MVEHNAIHSRSDPLGDNEKSFMSVLMFAQNVKWL